MENEIADVWKAGVFSNDEFRLHEFVFETAERVQLSAMYLYRFVRAWTVLHRRSASSSPVFWREVARYPRHPQGPPIKGPLQSGPVAALLLFFITFTSHAVGECIEGRRRHYCSLV